MIMARFLHQKQSDRLEVARFVTSRQVIVLEHVMRLLYLFKWNFIEKAYPYYTQIDKVRVILRATSTDKKNQFRHQQAQSYCMNIISHYWVKLSGHQAIGWIQTLFQNYSKFSKISKFLQSFCEAYFEGVGVFQSRDFD